MTHRMQSPLSRRLWSGLLGTAILAAPCALTACDKDENSSKSTTTKTTVTPDGVKKTTETTEKKVETQPKNP